MRLAHQRENGMTLVESVSHSIIRAIKDGQWPIGGRIPSIRQLARDWEISPFSVAEAYDRLVAQGYLHARAGSGFFVAGGGKPAPAAPVVELSALPVDDHWLLQQVFEHDDDALLVGCGWLPPDWRDANAQQRALRALARQPNRGLGYGDPRGLAILRSLLAEKLAEKGIPAGARQIVLSQGASRALDMVAGTFLQPGDCVLVDDPGYCNLLSSLRHRGLRLLGVPWGPQGPQLAPLQTLLEAHRPKAFFTNPWLHNPTGASYSPSCAHQVVKLAEQYQMLLIEDDVSADFCEPRSPTLAALDGLRQTIYIGSFSKSVAPGLRVGYLAADDDKLAALLRYKMMSGLTSAELNERLVAEIVQQGGYRRQLERLGKQLAAAQQRAQRQLRQLGWRLFAEPDNGLFLLAQPPEPCDPRQLAETARKQGILLAPGHLFRPYSADSAWLRFNVAYAHAPRLWQFLAECRPVGDSMQAEQAAKE